MIYMHNVHKAIVVVVALVVIVNIVVVVVALVVVNNTLVLLDLCAISLNNKFNKLHKLRPQIVSCLRF